MLLKLLLVSFFPLIYGGNVTATNPPIPPKALNGTDLLKKISTNTTKIIIPVEGGAITQIDTNLTLPKDDIAIPLALEKEFDRPKNTSSVVARKGAPLNDSKVIESAPDKSSDTDQKVLETKLVKKNGTKIINSSKSDIPIVKNNSEVHVNHKPTILSYEALSGASKGAPSAPISSSKTFVSDQIPNPNDHMKGQTIDGNQPGMIMPVVITILTVPLFAVLGYMALRRGQEAWKNRHYKRMDFLLDGMYND